AATAPHAAGDAERGGFAKTRAALKVDAARFLSGHLDQWSCEAGGDRQRQARVAHGVAADLVPPIVDRASLSEGVRQGVRSLEHDALVSRRAIDLVGQDKYRLVAHGVP